MSESQRGKKLAYFLQQLEDRSLRELQEYLGSPLFGNSLQMVELLAAALRHLDGDALDIEKIHAHLFPDKKWDTKRSKYLQLRLVQLLNHLMDYFALVEYREDEQARFRYRLLSGIRNDWGSYLQFMYTQAHRNLPEGQGSARLLATLQLETNYNSYLSGIAASVPDTHLGQVHQALDSYYLLQKLKYASASANAAFGTGHTYKDPLLSLVLGHVESLPEEPDHLLVKAYAHAYHMISMLSVPREGHDADAHFQLLKDFFKLKPPVAKGEMLDLSTYALNFCTIRIHQGHAAYIAETRGLYDQMLDGGLLLEEGQLAAGYAKNIVTIMCRFKELDWAENFVEEYKDRIAADPKQLTYHYNKAVLAFHRGDYAATVRILYHRIHEFTDILFGIAARNYLCRALWNQKEYNWLSSNLSSFRAHLKRQKDLLETDRRIHLLYVKYFEQILNAHTTNPDRSRQKLEAIRKHLVATGEGVVFQSLRLILDDLLDGE